MKKPALNIWKKSGIVLSYSYKNISVLLSAGLFVCSMTIVQAWAISSILDEGFNPSNAKGLFICFIEIFIVFSILKGIGIFLSNYFESNAALKLKEAERKNIISRFFRIFPGSTETELISLLNNQFESLETYYGEYLPSVYLSIFSPLIFLIAIFISDIYSGIILLVTAPLIPLFMFLIGNKAKSMTDKQWHILGRLSYYFLDTLQGITTLKVFGRSKDRIKKISEITEEFRISTIKILRIAFVSSLTIELVSTLSIAIAAVSIGIRLLNGKIEYFNAIFILILAPEFYYPLRKLAAKFHAGLEGKIIKEKIHILLKNDMSDDERSNYESFPGLINRVEQIFPLKLENLDFSYEKNKKIIKNFSLEVTERQTIGIKGKSGSGKSTLINLITGLLEPESGNILFNARKLCKKELASIFGWVPQNPYIFNKSIKKNILIGREIATESQIEMALRISCLEEFVSSLHNGIETVVGERGMNLSAGQIQKIAIARAVIKDAPILILDEATSSIDILCEEELVFRLREYSKLKTVIFAAHRGGVFKNADKIVDLDNLIR
ncbi:MAG: thiol reductant ABC exporter subunit CydD [Lentisphaerae bacterium GWF2_38_69]|nr:MAG: thiol reductant ABC exporter subunit CydD [Lentisphaerae bacterium GWF2_38_69]